MTTIIPTGTKICPNCYRPTTAEKDDRWTGYQCGSCKHLFAINLKYDNNGMVACPYCKTNHRFGEVMR